MVEKQIQMTLLEDYLPCSVSIRQEQVDSSDISLVAAVVVRECSDDDVEYE